MSVFQKSFKPKEEVLKRSQSLKAKKRVGKIIFLFVLLAFLIFGLGYLLYLPALSVRTISVQGNDILETKDITTLVDQTLVGQYWYLFPRRSIFIYPQKMIIANLLKQFPRLAKVEVGLGEWDSLMIGVKERDSDSIWCRGNETPPNILTGQTEEVVATTSSTEDMVKSVSFAQNNLEQNCYFADSTGFIFAPAPYFSNSVFMELSGLLPLEAIGQAPLSARSYTIITHFAKNLAKIFNKTTNDNYRLIKVDIVAKNNYEAIITDTSRVVNGDWKILFDNDGSAEELTNNLYTVLNSEPFKKEMLANQDNLASIDLRYGQKVFYKFKN